MKSYKIAMLSWMLAILFCASVTEGIIYRDNFDRSNEDLIISPHWKCAHGAYYGFQIRNNRVVSIYYPDTGGIIADRYARVAYSGQAYQQTAIDFRFPEVTQDGHNPGFYLNLNWSGPKLFASTYLSYAKIRTC